MTPIFKELQEEQFSKKSEMIERRVSAGVVQQIEYVHGRFGLLRFPALIWNRQTQASHT